VPERDDARCELGVKHVVAPEELAVSLHVYPFEIHMRRVVGKPDFC
jgi:hypothetical protein